METTSIKQIAKNSIKFSNLWGSVIPMHILGGYCVYLISTGNAPIWWPISFVIGYVLLSIVGLSIGYHRLFSHRSFDTSPVLKKVILFLGLMAGQGSPVFWIGIHRGYHHRYSDKSKDAHSPIHGFWHSYMLWMFKRDTTSLWGLAPRSIIDLLKDPGMMFFHKHYIKILLTVHVIVGLISIDLWLFGLVLPAIVTLHSFCLQTSLTHYPKLGYKNYPTRDDSVNVPWLFPIVFGDAWHNNHHGRGRDPNLGGRRWWEIDPAYWIIKLIRYR